MRPGLPGQTADNGTRPAQWTYDNKQSRMRGKRATRGRGLKDAIDGKSTGEETVAPRTEGLSTGSTAPGPERQAERMGSSCSLADNLALAGRSSKGLHNVVQIVIRLS